MLAAKQKMERLRERERERRREREREFIVEREINSKCGVWPLMTHPSAIKPSNFLIFFDITTGISKTPGTDTNLYLACLYKTFAA